MPRENDFHVFWAVTLSVLSRPEHAHDKKKFFAHMRKTPYAYLIEEAEMASIEELETEIWLREGVRVVLRTSGGEFGSRSKTGEDFGYYGFTKMADHFTIGDLKRERFDPFFRGMPYAIIGGDGLDMTHIDSRSLGSLRYTYRQELSR